MTPFTATVELLGDPSVGEIAVVRCAGQLDAAAADVLHDAFAQAAALRATAGPRLALDDVTYINSTGIAVVVELIRRAHVAGLTIQASGLTPHYRHVFELTRLTDHIDLVDDGGRAVAGPEPAL